MSKQVASTPTPWTAPDEDSCIVGLGWKLGDSPVCEYVSEADAALIVRAVNSHAALVEALEAVTHELGDYLRNYMAGERWKDHPEMQAKRKVFDRARAALKLARGDA